MPLSSVALVGGGPFQIPRSSGPTLLPLARSHRVICQQERERHGTGQATGPWLLLHREIARPPQPGKRLAPTSKGPLATLTAEHHHRSIPVPLEPAMPTKPVTLTPAEAQALLAFLSRVIDRWRLRRADNRELFSIWG